METWIFGIIKTLVGPEASSYQLILGLIATSLLLLWKYLIKPWKDSSKESIESLTAQSASQSAKLTNINEIIERLDVNIKELKRVQDNDHTISNSKIIESQHDIIEIKMILSQFQGMLMFNSRLNNNKELD